MSKYPQGLGLYNYHQQVHTTLPPSPAASDSWSNHVTSGASPLMTPAIADPYASGAFEHPIIRSPQPWEAAQLTPRPSMSPVATAPVFAQTGADNTYREISQGLGSVSLGGYDWPHDARYLPTQSTSPSLRHYPLTVAPERLNGTMLPYENVYSSTPVATLEAPPATQYEGYNSVSGSNKRTTRSRTNFPQAATHSARRQPARTSNPTASPTVDIYCNQCETPKKFSRLYNYKKHLETHLAVRDKPWTPKKRSPESKGRQVSQMYKRVPAQGHMQEA
ncbi:hypothetical protein OPT61_g1743 [Boeremia exigua]|uniref:Uncharacterized protein n=1 Tax=Boeremia exigua TaxID=749465 RepID=A0ACC2IP08_9PLEO|nr:hypothetical protein OPT61_g1743 [Boeremia exigua]